jgi:hypothetical protein
LEVLKGGRWVDLEISSAVRAVVLLNLQSYGGGRNLWGKNDEEVCFRRPLSLTTNLSKGMQGFLHTVLSVREAPNPF